MSAGKDEDSNYLKLLRILKGSNGYISGEHISKVLGVSRVSIWKYISMLRRYGYTIESRQRRGYRLTGIPDRLLPWEIMDRLKGKSMIKDVVYYEEVESTQDLALRLAEQGKHSILVVAERQSKGRGRLARHWVSPYGGIWFSFIIKPRHLSNIGMISLLSALAVCHAINSNYKLDAMIKWPNDVVIRYRKVAGILVDASMEQDEMHYAVIGIGINANVSKDAIERYIKDGYRYGLTTLMDELKMQVDRVMILADTIIWFEQLYGMLHSNKAGLMEELKRHMVLGRVQVVSREESIEGNALGIDEDDGSLIVEKGGRVMKIFAGDVYIRY